MHLRHQFRTQDGDKRSTETRRTWADLRVSKKSRFPFLSPHAPHCDAANPFADSVVSAFGTDIRDMVGLSRFHMLRVTLGSKLPAMPGKMVVVSTIGAVLRRRGIGVGELRQRLAQRGIRVSRGA